MSHDFNFAKFCRQSHDKELPSQDEIIGLASVAVPPNDPLEQYLLDPILKINIDLLSACLLFLVK